MGLEEQSYQHRAIHNISQVYSLRNSNKWTQTRCLVFLLLILSFIYFVILTIYVDHLNKFVSIHDQSLTLTPLETQRTKGVNRFNCETEECFASAERILESVDASVDPCDNFYQFACGGWIKKKPTPKGVPIVSQFTNLSDDVMVKIKHILESTSTNETLVPLRKARSLYNSCIDGEKIEKMGMDSLNRILKGLGFIKSRRSSTTTSWQDIIANTENLLGTSLLFDMDITRHPEDTSKYVIYIHPGNMNSIDDAMMLNIEKREADIALMAHYIGLLPNTPLQHKVVAERITVEAYDLIKELRRLQQELDDDDLLYEDMTIADLQRITDSELETKNIWQTRFIWSDYMKTVFRDLNMNWEIERIVVRNGLYFKRWAKLLQKKGLQAIESFELWKIYSLLVPFTAPQKSGHRWMGCAKQATNIFGLAIGHDYVTKYFEKDDKEKVLEIVRDIQSAFKDRVKNRDWMDVTTKKLTAEKIDAISTHVGYPNWLFEPGKIEQHYQNLEIFDNDWFNSMVNVMKFTHHLKMKTLAEQTQGLFEIPSPVSINAFYNADVNSITIPAAILHPPLFRLGLDALNYGAIGAIIGHELIHGFDETGRYRDLRGNRKQWWTMETLAEFDKRKQCMINQYNHFEYTAAESNYKVNGEVTQSENIADNGGIQAALHAYNLLINRRMQHQEVSVEPSLPFNINFSHMQLFFLSFANVMCKSASDYAKIALSNDKHSPSEFRVLGAFSNTKEFASAWSCPIGSKMNPANKCVLW